jgi:uncharacterized membrane protein (UPF0136 family)
MGIEMVAVVIFGLLLEASLFLEKNGQLIGLTFGFVILWILLTLAAVRRWRAE